MFPPPAPQTTAVFSAPSPPAFAPDVANIGSPWTGGPAVSSTLPPSPTFQDAKPQGPKPQDFNTEDTQLRQQPRYPHGAQQRHRHHQHQHQHHHQHPHQHPQFGVHGALFGLNPSSFPALQQPPPPGGVPSIKSEEVESSGSSFGGGGGGPPFSASATPEGYGSSDSVDGGGRVLLPMEEVRVEPSRKVRGNRAYLCTYLWVCLLASTRSDRLVVGGCSTIHANV